MTGMTAPFSAKVKNDDNNKKNALTATATLKNNLKNRYLYIYILNIQKQIRISKISVLIIETKIF